MTINKEYILSIYDCLQKGQSEEALKKLEKLLNNRYKGVRNEEFFSQIDSGTPIKKVYELAVNHKVFPNGCLLRPFTRIGVANLKELAEMGLKKISRYRLCGEERRNQLVWLFNEMGIKYND